MIISIDNLCSHVGEAKLREMVAAFCRRVKTDDLIGPLYSVDDWEGSQKRLADFLIHRHRIDRCKKWGKSVLTAARSGLVWSAMSKPKHTHTSQLARHHINVLGQILKIIPRDSIHKTAKET